MDALSLRSDVMSSMEIFSLVRMSSELAVFGSGEEGFEVRFLVFWEGGLAKGCGS